MLVLGVWILVFLLAVHVLGWDLCKALFACAVLGLIAIFVIAICVFGVGVAMSSLQAEPLAVGVFSILGYGIYKTCKE